MTSTKKDAVPESEMSIMSHLSELRMRLIRSAIAIVVGVIVVWAFFKEIFGVLEEPYCDYKEGLGQECDFLLTTITEAFSTVLSLSGWGGLVLATPVILYQLARFIMPGLYPDERKVLAIFIPISVGLMFTGMATGYFLMPKAVEVLLSFGDIESFDAQLSPKAYVAFFVKMLLAFGVSFQLPVVLVFLQKVGLVKPETLRSNRRYAIVMVVAAGAVITPTGDPFTLAVISIPMYLFYELSILVGTRIKTRSIKSGDPAT